MASDLVTTLGIFPVFFISVFEVWFNNTKIQNMRSPVPCQSKVLNPSAGVWLGCHSGSFSCPFYLFPCLSSEVWIFCIFFLDSLQGSECEYRHSETARFNPRDCWYWLNGNCLNPACSFRHPVSLFLYLMYIFHVHIM